MEKGWSEMSAATDTDTVNANATHATEDSLSGNQISQADLSLGLSKRQTSNIESTDDTKSPSLIKREHDRCMKMRESVANKSESVRFLLKSMARMGCPVSRNFVTCRQCTPEIGGGFNPEEGIVICENYVISKTHVKEVISHELIHAYDHCRGDVDWNNCLHHACSEVRAANLSGDCRFFNELSRGKFGLKSQHQKCVRRRALLSVNQNPSCQNGLARQAVDAAFKSCITDVSPWNDMPKKYT